MIVLRALSYADCGIGIVSHFCVFGIDQRPQNVFHDFLTERDHLRIRNFIQQIPDAVIGIRIVQPKVVSCPNSLISGHVISLIGIQPVGHKRAAELPFVPQNFRAKTVIRARPNSAQTVHARHKRVSAALFCYDFKRFQIDFAQGLLGHEGV